LHLCQRCKRMSNTVEALAWKSPEQSCVYGDCRRKTRRWLVVKFMSGSDESAGKTQRDTFFFGGFVAPEEDWSRFFEPAWQERVLDGPPAIPYLHMTEIRSQKWRSQFGLSRAAADERVDEAFSVIETMGSLYPIGIHVDGGHVLDKFATAKVVAAR